MLNYSVIPGNTGYRMKTITETLFILALACIAGLLTNLVHPKGVAIALHRPAAITVSDAELDGMELAPEGPMIINLGQVEKLISGQNSLVIDARLPEEYSAGHIPGAINVSLDLIGEQIQKVMDLPRSQKLVTYCDGPPCDKSAVLGQELYSLGFTHVYIYDAGLVDWTTAGKPTETGGEHE